MAKDKQHKGSPKGVSGAGSTGRSGARPQGQQEQQEQGGDVSQQGGTTSRDDERLDDDAQSGSSPRSRSDSPDEGQGGART